MTLDLETSTRINAGISELLADGQWHTFGQLISVADGVPPEVATRIYINSRRGKGGDKPLDEQVSRGRRELIRRRLYSLVHKGQIEVEGSGFGRSLRLSQFDMRAEAVAAVDEVMARQSTERLSGTVLKDYLTCVAATLLFKVGRIGND